MPSSRASLRSKCWFLVLILCLGGCGSAVEDTTAGSGGTKQGLTLVGFSDKKVDVEVFTQSSKTLSLYVGEKMYASGPVEGGKNELVWLEVSNQIQLEDGALGHGMIFTRDIRNGRGSRKHLLAITENGPLPYGKASIRKTEAIVEAADSLTIADIERPDGSKVPISLKLE